MTIIVPQQNITQSFTLNQAQILALLSGFVVAPATANFVYIFQRASVSYRYSATPFTNANNALSFKVNSRVVSNQLNAVNILALSQSTTVTFSPANPYPTILDSDVNKDLIFAIDTANVLGGDANSTLSLNVTYGILQLT